MLYIPSPASGAPLPSGQKLSRESGSAAGPVPRRWPGPPPPARGEAGAPRAVPAAPFRAHGAAGHPRRAHLAAPPSRERRPRAIQAGAESGDGGGGLAAPPHAGTPSRPRASPAAGPAWEPHRAAPGGWGSRPPRTHRGGDGAELGAQQQPEAQPEPHAAAHRTAPRRRVPGRRGAGGSLWGSAGPAPHARLSPPWRRRRLQCLGGEGLAAP